MVMSGGGQGDPRDDETTAEEAVSWIILSKITPKSSSERATQWLQFRRTIFDRADLTEGDFTSCDFRRRRWWKRI